MSTHWNSQKWRDSPHLKWGIRTVILSLLAIIAVQGWVIHGQSSSKHTPEVQSTMHTPYGVSSISGFEVQVEPDQVVISGKVPNTVLSDLQVNVQDGQLVIDYEGHQRDDMSHNRDKFGGYVVRQRSFSSRFNKAITLPDDIDPTNMKTEIEDGVLTVQIPRTRHPVS
ncbi:MAG: Hsp20/alpha crystallin family protein [Magnetococcales bacterium]|nr:Hsp20/alpha crystallin family protein [Magnetococcales bacterium]